MANYFQPIMDLRIRATLPLTGSSDDAMLEGARRNRMLVAYASSLGYQDVTVSVAMRNKRVPDSGPIALPALPKGAADLNADDPDEFQRMARKLAK